MDSAFSNPRNRLRHFHGQILEGVPTRADVIGATRLENTPLANRLDIQLPGNLIDAPPTLAFNRVREVRLPWADLLEAMAGNTDGAVNGIFPLRAYFERSWWNEEGVRPNQQQIAQAMTNGWLIFLPDAAGRSFFRYAGTVNPPEKIESGVVLRNAFNGRYYRLETTGEPLPDIRTPSGYIAFWDQHVEAATLVFASEDELGRGQTAFRELDLRAIYIERRYRELVELQRVVRSVSATASKALEEIIAMGRGADLNFEALEAVQARYISIRLNPYRIRRDLQQLKRQAQKMGYILFLEDESGMVPSGEPVPDGEAPRFKKTFKFPNDKEDTVYSGELYTSEQIEVEYYVKHRKSTVGNFFGRIGYAFAQFFAGTDEKYESTWEEEKQTHEKVTKYTRVDMSSDPLGECVEAYRAQGKEVHVLTETPSGFVSDEGLALSTVMMRCEYDEAYRRRCVVMLPVYETSFAVERPIVAYNIFDQPLPGILPARLPRLFVDESLTYRTAWKQAEVGELVNTINLAPGETREITITRAFQEERTTSETRTSVSELNSAENTDLATEMESVARTEGEFSAHVDSSTEASANGTFQGFGSASASSKFAFGASDTLKTFSQSMNKVAKKAATSISRKSKLDVTTNSSAKTTISTTDSTLIKMSNINEGRTLNLMFYRLYNRYEAGLFVEGVRFGVTSGVELIAGSGIYETVSFQPERIRDMLDMFKRVPLPFNSAPSAVAYYQLTILNTILNQLNLEYLAAGNEAETPPAASAKEEDGAATPASALTSPPSMRAAGSIGAIVIPRQLIDLFDKPVPPRPGTQAGKSVAPPVDPGELEARVAEVEKGLREVEINPTPLGRAHGGVSDLLIATGGLYMDALVGARPSTEPYSEEMRAQEVRKSAAEVLKAEADAQYSLAQARRIGGMPAGSNPSGNVLTGVHALEEGDVRLLTLGLALPLAAGDWTLCVDGKPVEDGAIPVEQLQRTSIVLRLPARDRGRKAHWSEAPDLMRRVSLRDLDTEDEIGSV